MILSIRPDKQNFYARAGVIIRGGSPHAWFRGLQELELRPEDVNLYPLPGTTANSIWGCLVEFDPGKYKLNDPGRNDFAQCVHELLFVPSLSLLFPHLHAEELRALLKGRKHFLHPEIGLIELPEPVDIVSLIAPVTNTGFPVSAPKAPEFIPRRVRSFMVKPLPPKEAVQNMLEEAVGKPDKPLDGTPLSTAEKGKLFFYRMLFKREKNPETGKTENTPTPLFGFVNRIREAFGGSKDGSWGKEIEQNYDDLEKRTQENMDRLLDMLRDNPEEALKYAIPVDMNGTGRGGVDTPGSAFDLSLRWTNFSLHGRDGRGGGGSFTTNRADDLVNEYNRIAQELINKKDYRKAAFVYHKLLKQHHRAGETLEQGALYPEAAGMYLEYCQNKENAARCYEKGKMTEDAISLYKDLNRNEKVGDLYVEINRRKDANVYYDKTAEEYKGRNQYVKASLIYREKMLQPEAGQEILLSGWRQNIDATNCMGIYFSNIASEKDLHREYERFYKDDVDENNRTRFIYVVGKEFQKQSGYAERLKTMAYEAAVQEIPNNPRIVSELQEFNKKDKQFMNDTLRFRNIKNRTGE